MSAEAAELVRFFAFGIVWLFPVALIITVLGFGYTPLDGEAEDLGPNVVRFPEREPEAAHPEKSWPARLKQLAFRHSSR